jgi:DNA-binding CsgD family transcriptional regulator
MTIATLYGREQELETVHGTVAAAGDRGGALLVRGEEGIGKSAVLEAARIHARTLGMTVLGASGVESETKLPFAGLHQILRPILHGVDELPDPQRRALLAAFGISGEGAPDVYLTALASLSLLAEAAGRGDGLLVVVDDAQWLDLPTSEVLTFVARRVESDAVVLVIALRDGLPTPLDAAGLPEVRLERLDDEASAALVDATAPNLTQGARRRVLEEAAGNPLGLVELPSALAAYELTGDVELPPRLPLTARLERAFAARLSELSPAARSLVQVAAVDDAGNIAEILAAATIVEGSEVTAADLAPAIRVGLIRTTDGELLFRHPLVRSAIYQEAGDARRLAAHAALAAVLTADPDRRAWHRAAATLGPDDEVAAELEEAATRAKRRGAAATAVAALERAAVLSADSGYRAMRLVAAAEMAFDVGRRDILARLLREAGSMNLGSLERARIVWIREQTDPHIVTDRAGVHSLVGIADRARADGDIGLAVDLLWLVAQRCWWKDPGKEARDLVITAAERTGLPAEDPRLVAILAYAAPVERGAIVTDRLAAAASTGPRDPVAGRLLGNAALVVGSFDLGVAFLAEANGVLRAQGRLGHLSRVLTLQAWGAILLGDWSVAVPAAEEAVALAAETEDPIWVAGAQAVRAVLAAFRGQELAADELAREAEGVAAPLRAGFILAVVQLARGVAALGRGRPTEAYEQLRRVFDTSDPAYHHSVRTWAVGDFTEAAVHSGHRQAAERIVDEMERLAERTPATWFQAGMRYARALLASDEVAEPLFHAALEGDTQWPIHRARVLLAYGIWLRRQRRVAESRQPLRAARDSFDAIGVVPWAERARQELRASGEVSRTRAPSAWDQLSPQELQIAQMAADGLSNREIGERLYLSHRTVGSHLYRIFPKLGVTSRAHLPQALSAGQAAPASVSPMA